MIRIKMRVGPNDGRGQALDARLMPQAEVSRPARSFCGRRCGVCQTMERNRDPRRRAQAKYLVCRPFSRGRAGDEVNRVGYREASASDTTPEIAGLQENDNISAVDWAVIDASGTPRQTLKQCETRITHPGRLRPNSANSNVAIPKISKQGRPSGRTNGVATPPPDFETESEDGMRHRISSGSAPLS